MTRTVPSVWCIDVEPDATVPTADERRWTGFDAMVELVERVRPALAARSGAPVHPLWGFRMDPMIEAVYGRADHVVVEHPELIDTILAAGDPLGLHVHPYRFDPDRAAWYTDHTDLEWSRHCLTLAVDTFTASFGRAPTTVRMGGYYLPGGVVDLLIELGLRIDLTAEPGRRPIVEDSSHAAFTTEPSTDFRAFPRRRYRPSRSDVSVRAPTPGDARAITLVPLTAFDWRSRLMPRHRAVARRVVRRGPRYEPLSPWRAWPSARWYWDCAASAVKQVGGDHFAFALRTLPMGDEGGAHQDRVVEGLVDHPLASRLRFVDPLELDLDPAREPGVV